MMKKISAEEINENFFKLIGTDWALLSAGTQEEHNMMTVSWGGAGVLWNKNVCFVFVRPQRYTYGFLENNSEFSLSFYDEKHKDVLKLCGTKSGRDINKTRESGLTCEKAGNTITFKEAKMTIVCEKLYYQDFDKNNFLNPDIMKNYANNDFHRMYVGEIKEIIINE